MERKRKGYLLRKSDLLDHLNYNPQVNGNVASLCSCNKSSARSYDLQTQTITFEEEPARHQRDPYTCPTRKTSEDQKKVPDNSSSMDQDLEFYPVDDHPSPSTFTAWDAFLAGNQAFFREPPGLLPDPAFSYMDVIPEEDDLEALLESDTDDTGSSVSTVIDRFSRTSTANSSFSERCKGTTEVTFDLQKVLSPFERLEKELDGDESKDDHDLLRRKEISRGPIVVITNSSSCEDVHSAGEEDSSNVTEIIVQTPKEELIIETSTAQHVNETVVSNGLDTVPPLIDQFDSNEKAPQEDNANKVEVKIEVVKTPQVPARSKLVNGSRASDKTKVKSEKSDVPLPSSSPKKKKSYPTPSVPPRMSKQHLPARRTRSDPGSSDQPSRIPRPISTPNRSPTNNATPKSNSKSNRSPKMNTQKKLKFSGSPKSSRGTGKTSSTASESPVVDKSPEVLPPEAAKIPKMNVVSDVKLDDDTITDLQTVVSENNGAPEHSEPTNETNNLIETFETTPTETTTVLLVTENDIQDDSVADDLFPPSSDFGPAATSSDERQTNPFRKSETNPFKNTVESKNPFVTCNNPFEENTDSTSSLQLHSKIVPPPIPERPSLIVVQNQEKSAEDTPESLPNVPELPCKTSTEVESTIETMATVDETLTASSTNVTIDENLETSDTLSTQTIYDAIEATLNDMNIIEKNVATTESTLETISNVVDHHQVDEVTPDTDMSSGPQRPIEDILQALDQLVLAAPREVEISIDWGVRGPVNIREKTVLPSDASGDRSEISETDGLTDDRRRDIETLLKEVDECLKLHKASEDLSAQQPTEKNPLPASDSLLSEKERTSLSPGSLDAPTAGSTPLNLCHHEGQGTLDTNILLEHSPTAMLKHQSQTILAGEQRVGYSVPYQEVYSKTAEQLDEDVIVGKNQSSGCDDSGVFLEDHIASSPETQSRSAANRLQSTLDKFSSESAKMRQYSIQEGLDSDAERSDDLGLASSSIDSADDLDGDPLPSTLQISSCPPIVSPKQKPPPVPARKFVSKSVDYQKNNRYYSEITTLEVPNQHKPPLSKSSSSGEDSNFGEGDHCMMDNNSPVLTLSEKSKNMLNQQKNEQSRSNFAMTRSFHEDMLLSQQRDSNQDSKSNFLARTLSSSSSVKKLDVTNGNSSAYSRRSCEQPSGLKWKSEECLRTAAENKWSIPGRRYERCVSVKDRIAMFSEMEANQSTGKKEDLQRYGSETNIKAITGNTDAKKAELPLVENNKNGNLLKDSKWHSMHSIAKKPIEKETTYHSTTMKPALSIPSLTANNLTDSMSNNYATLPVKLDVEPPKPIVSTYPETQLTNNKRYNYGLYSLKNLKNTENLLSKKAAGSNLLSIIDSRKQPTQKLKGLVIPDKPYQVNSSKELPTIVSSDADGLKDSRRTSLPITAVTAAKAMSLPRNKKLECVPAQRQTSLSEPPWKSDYNNSYTLPKYSPAFKKRSLELPGSSLSPTPPSSITSPMSPPPSSPSSICSSNASSTLQQNVFQFSLSHSKPVQPLQPEKALMSPPSMPSDVEYEGDNSEDSSHSASPMRGSARSNKDVKTNTQHQNLNTVSYSVPNTFTSTAKNVPHQPMMVETLVKSPPPPDSEPPKPKAAIYLSKTEILLKKDEPKSDLPPRNQDFESKSEFNEFVSTTVKSNDQILPDITSCKTNGTHKEDNYSQMKIEIPEHAVYEKKNGDLQYSNEYFSTRVISKTDVMRNGSLTTTQSYMATEITHPDVQLGKFHALPVSLKDSECKSPANNGHQAEERLKKHHEPRSWGNGRPPHSECEESEDDDSHSTLSHRTEDSRHTTTDDCLSDATTDSFEKPRLLPEPANMQRSIDDNASTEGYLSDASTDVSIRRFTNRPIDCNAYSTEEYLSDATAESPDPDWVSHRGSMDQSLYSRSKSYGRHETILASVSQDGCETSEKNVDLDLRPRRLSQQRTVLKAAAEPSGSVQKFKALAEKWEQRADVTSPPPPVVVATAAPSLPAKKEQKSNSMASGIITSTCVTSTVIKGKGTLPPSLMPRNSAERKAAASTKSSKDAVYSVRTTTEKESTSTADGLVTRKSISSTSTVIETTNGWNPQYDEINRQESSPRRDSVSSGSSSSKTTLKDEVFDTLTPDEPETNGFDGVKHEIIVPPPRIEDSRTVQSNQRQSQVSLPTRQEDVFNNEPRNRRGADFSRTNPIPDWPKSNRPAFGAKSTFSVSDIRRSFENGSKEADKPAIPPKKAPIPAARVHAPLTSQQAPPPVPARKPSVTGLDEDEELRPSSEAARHQLRHEGVGDQFDVLTVILRREGEGGGSVGITLAGGADYEVKEITVHKVISGSIADRDGRVLKGDRVMSINGRDLRGVSHGEALHILKAPSPRVLLVLARDRRGGSSIPQQNGTTERRQDYGNNKDTETILVELLKDATGLGFSIEGGRDSPQGDRPLLIKRIFKGGAADKEGQLEEGDEIMSVNDQPVSNMTRTEAWNFLKKLPEGPVLLKARKATTIVAS